MSTEEGHMFTKFIKKFIKTINCSLLKKNWCNKFFKKFFKIKKEYILYQLYFNYYLLMSNILFFFKLNFLKCIYICPFFFIQLIYFYKCFVIYKCEFKIIIAINYP